MAEKAFDNISIGSITILLNEDTTLKRYYPLIPYAKMLSERLMHEGIVDKYDFFSVFENSPNRLSQILDIDENMLNLFDRFLHLHDFINRKLNEITSVDSEYIQQLSECGMKTSKDYLLMCIASGLSSDAASKIFCLCDLMRLPGVKDTRASLYFDCGYRNLSDFSTQNTDDMQSRIADYIRSNNIDKSIPLRKELSTQIAVAKVLPHIEAKKQTP